jgi:hypothetical protein
MISEIYRLVFRQKKDEYDCLLSVCRSGDYIITGKISTRHGIIVDGEKLYIWPGSIIEFFQEHGEDALVAVLILIGMSIVWYIIKRSVKGGFEIWNTVNQRNYTVAFPERK